MMSENEAPDVYERLLRRWPINRTAFGHSLPQPKDSYKDNIWSYDACALTKLTEVNGQYGAGTLSKFILSFFGKVFSGSSIPERKNSFQHKNDRPKRIKVKNMTSNKAPRVRKFWFFTKKRLKTWIPIILLDPPLESSDWTLSIGL